MSISNLLSVVTIHSTAILTMLASCLVQTNTPLFSAYLPLSYKYVVDHFRNMVSMQRKSELSFFQFCYSHIMSRSDIPSLIDKLLKMLWIILDIMIGLYKEEFNPLKYAMSNDVCYQRHEAHHCLTLVLSLFCNIGQLLPDVGLERYQLKIYECIQHCDESDLKDACRNFLKSHTIAGCLGVIRDLLNGSQDTLFELYVRLDNIGVYFTTGELMKTQLQRRLNPIPVHDNIKTPALVTIQVPLEEPLASSNEKAQDINALPNTIQDISVTQPDSKPSPGFRTLDSVEAEDDDFETEETIQQETEKDPMVNEKTSMCRVCGCPLQHDFITSKTDTSENNAEKYSDHIRSEKHQTNTKIYHHFESEMEYYLPKKKDLLELKTRCVELYKILHVDDLRSRENTIDQELKSTEHTIMEIRESAEWRQGVTLLQGIFGRLESLGMKTRGLLEKCEKQKDKLEKAKDEQRKKVREEEEEEERENEFMDDFEEIGGISAKSGVNSKMQKRKRRKKRRHKEF